MQPERVTGAPGHYDPRSDVWAYGYVKIGLALSSSERSNRVAHRLDNMAHPLTFLVPAETRLTLAEIALQRFPFTMNGQTILAKIEAIVEGVIPDLPDGFSPEAKEFIDMWSVCAVTLWGTVSKVSSCEFFLSATLFIPLSRQHEQESGRQTTPQW